MPMPQPRGPNAVRIEYTGNEVGPLVVNHVYELADGPPPP